MAIRKIEMRPPGSGNYADVLYPKTSDDIIDITAGTDLTATNLHAGLIEILTAISGKALTTHSHAHTDITGLGTASTKNTGTSNGNVPILDVSGKLNTSVLPGLSLTTTNVVATEALMLALTAEPGDIAVRTDIKKTFVLKTAGASTLSNWQELLTPTDVVTSVAGKTGVVTLAKGDVGLGNADNTSDANKPISTATQSALDLKSASNHVHGADEITIVTSDFSSTTVQDTIDEFSSVMFDYLSEKAPLASPTFTGTPLSTTPLGTDNSTKIATTAFVKGQSYLTAITKAMIEAQLTGTITSHSHSSGTPTAHASTHVTGGTDIIPNVVAGGSAGLMTGAQATKLASALTSFLTIGATQPTNGDLWFKELV